MNNTMADAMRTQAVLPLSIALLDLGEHERTSAGQPSRDTAVKSV
jgi:hypothetical protein